MKKSKFVHYRTWILHNFISLIMLPITVLFLIIGIYGRVFDNEFSNPDNSILSYLNINSYINFFEKQKELSTDIRIQKISINPVSTLNHSHILLLDRTMSTNETKLNVNDEISKKLRISLDSTFNIKPPINNELVFMDLIVLKVYQNLLNYELPCRYRTSFYNGNNNFINGLSLKNQKDTLEWITIDSDESRKLLVDKVIDQDLYRSYPNQKTDFHDIFDNIKLLCDTSNMIVTIISDFLHEGTNISDSDIEELQKGINKPSQFNLIYIKPLKNDDIIKSQKLLTKLIEKIHGSQILKTINSNDFNKDKLDSDILKKFDIDLSQCFSSINQEKEFITCFYPKNTDLTYKTAECLIVFEGYSQKPINWQVTTAYPQEQNKCFASYKIGTEESRLEIDGNWHSISSSDTLRLRFPINPNISNQYNLDIMQSSVSKSFLIQLNEYIPYHLAQIAIILLYSIISLIIVFVLLITIGHFLYLNKLKYQLDFFEENEFSDEYCERSLFRHNVLTFIVSLFIFIYFFIFHLNYIVLFAITVLSIIQVANFFVWRNFYKKLRYLQQYNHEE